MGGISVSLDEADFGNYYSAEISEGVKVTIAIPFHNDEKYLRYSIHSVLNQSFKDWELILLDDGSKDKSLEIAKNFECEKIKVVSDGFNKGLAVRLNELTRMSKGKYYARMDADDVMDIERIEKQVKYLEEHPEVDVVGSDVYVIDKDNHIIGKTNTTIREPKSFHDILNGGQFVHPSVMGKRQWFVEHPYDEKLQRMQDKGLWLRTVSSSVFIIQPQVLMYYRAGGLPTMKKNINELKCLKTIYFTILGKEQHRYGFACKLYFVSLVKLCVYAIFELFGQTDFLVKRRYFELKEEELNTSKQRLKKVIVNNNG